MISKVSWTKEAQTHIKEILEYWKTRNNSSSYSNKLLKLIHESILRLQAFPNIGRQTENEKIRLKIINNYFLYYSVNENELCILGIFDTRRNPDYLKSFLE